MGTARTRTQIGGERGELYVFGELLKKGVVPYVPLVDEGYDAMVCTPDGQVLKLQVKAAGSAGAKHPKWFQMSQIKASRDFFIIGGEFADDSPENVWVFPSAIFDKYASTPPKGSPRDLDLDSGVRKYGMPLKDLLCGFRNRWELIVKFSEFEKLIDSPEDLEDLLTMREAEESSDEPISLKD